MLLEKALHVVRLIFVLVGTAIVILAKRVILIGRIILATVIIGNASMGLLSGAWLMPALLRVQRRNITQPQLDVLQIDVVDVRADCGRLVLANVFVIVRIVDLTIIPYLGRRVRLLALSAPHSEERADTPAALLLVVVWAQWRLVLHPIREVPDQEVAFLPHAGILAVPIFRLRILFLTMFRSFSGVFLSRGTRLNLRQVRLRHARIELPTLHSLLIRSGELDIAYVNHQLLLLLRLLFLIDRGAPLAGLLAAGLQGLHARL